MRAMLIIGGKKQTSKNPLIGAAARCIRVVGQVDRALAFQLRHVVPVEAYPVR